MFLMNHLFRLTLMYLKNQQDLELQQQLIRFNKFLQENDSKTQRAEKKAKPETVRLILKLAPELHAWLAETAPRLGITLEQFAAAALDDFRDIATRGGSRPTLREVAADLKRGTPHPLGRRPPSER